MLKKTFDFFKNSLHLTTTTNMKIFIIFLSHTKGSSSSSTRKKLRKENLIRQSLMNEWARWTLCFKFYSQLLARCFLETFLHSYWNCLCCGNFCFCFEFCKINLIFGSYWELLEFERNEKQLRGTDWLEILLIKFFDVYSVCLELHSWLNVFYEKIKLRSIIWKIWQNFRAFLVQIKSKLC